MKPRKCVDHQDKPIKRIYVHTQFVMQNIKMVFLVQPTHPTLKMSCVTKYFFIVKQPTQVPLETEQLQKTYLLYPDNFIQPK